MWKQTWTSNLLTCLGAAGVIGTAVLTAKATPKALRLLEEAKEEKGEDLTKLETVKLAGPAYIPAIAVGASTIACIFGANMLNRHMQASLMSAYALLENSYNRYRTKVLEMYGDEADESVKEAIAREVCEEIDEPLSEDKQLFLDFKTLRYFESTMSDVIQKVTTEDGLECYIVSTPFDTACPDYSF